MIRRIFFILLLALSISDMISAREREVVVSGYVTDCADGEPLLGAGIIVSSETGCVTNNYGRYSLKVPEGRCLLTCSYLGYESATYEFSAQKDTVINFMLSANASINSALVAASAETGIHSPYMGSIDVPQQILKNTPVALGEPDVLKTIQMIPGVQSGEEGFSGVFIRGGSSDETLFLMDGAPIYNVSHLLGIFSSFTPDAVKKVTLYKGPFPSRYGGRVSGILDVRTNEGDNKRTRGSVCAGLLNERIHVEGPIVKDTLSYSVSARAMHSLLLAPVIKWAGSDLNYFFYDLNGKLTWRPGRRDKVFFSAYLGKDIFDCNLDQPVYDGEKVVSNDNENSRLRWGNGIVSLHWIHDYSARLFSEAYVYYTDYRYVSEWSVIPELPERPAYSGTVQSSIKDLGFSTDFDWRAGASQTLKFGLEVVHHNYSPNTNLVSRWTYDGKSEEASSNGGIPSRGWENAAYIEDNITLFPWMSLNAGIRAVMMGGGSDSYFSLEPRLVAKIQAGRGVIIKASAGRSSQYMHMLSSSSTHLAMPTDMWIPVTSGIRPVYSDIVSSGVSYSGIEGWEFTLEAYLKKSRNVIDYRDGVSLYTMTDNMQDLISCGGSDSKGAELFIEKKIGNTTGWLSYTLSKTDRLFKDGSVNHGRLFPDKYDRRHNISVCVNQRFNERMDLSLTWIFQSGAMTTLPESLSALPHISDPESITPTPYVSSKNNFRLPASHRLNVSFNLHKPARKGESVWSFGIYNVYNAMNPNLVYLREETKTNSLSNSEVIYMLRKITILPFLPSVNYTYNF